MDMGVLGTGTVGQTIGRKLISLGHRVCMGGRSADNEKAKAWVEEVGEGGSSGTFADAARFGQIVWNCTLGGASLDALEMAGRENLADKILVDLANPLDFSHGFPPTLSIANTDSLGESIQRAFPDTRVVKTLNTINCNVMVDPSRVAGGEHDVFMSGNDASAKDEVRRILEEGFGWKHVVDLGDITTARGTEAYLLLWIRLYGDLKTADFNVHVVR